MRVPWIVWTVIWLHLAWAAFLIASPTTMNTTPIRWLAMSVHDNRWVLSAALIMVAFSGWRWTRGEASVAWLLPQQFVLVISAGGSTASMLMQHYADGVVRSWAFIGAGEAVNVIVAIAHTLALMEVYGVLPRWAQRRV